MVNQQKFILKLSSLKKIIDQDLIVIRENRVIAEAIFLLENQIIELDSILPNLHELLNLRDDFFAESEKALNESKTMVNIIIYLIGKFDHHNKCGSQLNIQRLPRNFDSLLQLMFGEDHSICKDEVKNNLIRLTKEIETFELTIAFGKSRRNQSSSLASLHETDLLEFKKLTRDLDSLVVRFRSSQEQSIDFTEVIEANLDRLENDLIAVISQAKHVMTLWRMNNELDALVQKGKAKQAELKKRQNQSLDCADIEQEVVRLMDEIGERQKRIDEETEKHEFQKKLYQKTLNRYAEESGRHRQITESVVVEKQLSKKIKITLVKMAKLIDANFKTKYADLNEHQFFSNEINDALSKEIFIALEYFAKERTLIEGKENAKENELNESPDDGGRPSFDCS